ncbi:hemerythrin domain-containing protein [Brevibacillus agri]|uniref:hemerythrin domain-containing protein n=1 Tax=Brevibacillus agri TaxID=51101 RepID=UPI002E24AF48|nr:hemerythrin domain-containing protein [Brevibacillus agri]
MKRHQTDGERQLSQLFSREHVVLGQYMEKLKKLVYQNRSMSAEAVEQFRETIAIFVEKLRKHHALEEELLFAALTESLGYATPPVIMMTEEHRRLVSQVLEMREETACCECTGRGSMKLREVTTTLCRLLHDHFHQEEMLLFPMAEHVLSKETKEAILAAAACLAYPLIRNVLAFWPLIVMGAFATASIWFIRRKKVRHFVNDLLGIVGLTMLLPVAAALGGGAPGPELLAAMALNVAYFAGSIFFVKAVFREKHKQSFHVVGMIYHLLLLCLPFLPHVPALVSVIFLPGVVKMAIAAKGVKLPVKTVGIMEIGNVLWFLAGGYVLLAA